MASMRDPLVQAVHDLIGRSSVPEVVEALLTIARYYKRSMKKQGHPEYRGWEPIESGLAKLLKDID